MRISVPKLLLVVAFSIVILVELRTIVALFGVELSVNQVIVVGGIAIGLLLLYAVLPEAEGAED